MRTLFCNLHGIYLVDSSNTAAASFCGGFWRDFWCCFCADLSQCSHNSASMVHSLTNLLFSVNERPKSSASALHTLSIASVSVAG
mmetsp:Transcript_12928/g.16620  ORF Transcript_12928/g.16620 Transcript_12928/m.16620 type:complete len:85 (-) Transcript_12928:394-648(-)